MSDAAAKTTAAVGGGYIFIKIGNLIIKIIWGSQVATLGSTAAGVTGAHTTGTAVVSTAAAIGGTAALTSAALLWVAGGGMLVHRCKEGIDWAKIEGAKCTIQTFELKLTPSTPPDETKSKTFLLIAAEKGPGNVELYSFPSWDIPEAINLDLIFISTKVKRRHSRILFAVTDGQCKEISSLGPMFAHNTIRAAVRSHCNISPKKEDRTFC